MKKHWGRLIKTICIFIAIVLVVFMAGAWAMFGTFINAASSIKKLEDGLYVMEYKGDYGFDDFLKKGGAASDDEVANYLISFLSRGFYKQENKIETGEFGCSTINTTDEDGTVYFGRNYDWTKCKTMIIYTKPDNGYQSFSTTCLDFLGFDESYTPDGSMMERMQTLGAIYVPLDGMNEKGLIVADLMAGDRESTHQQTDKVDLTTTTAIRLLLDKAATVDEAINLLSQYDMHSSMDSAHHLSIADASGKSVVVEYVNGEMLVTETKIVTNHYLCNSEKKGIGSEQSHLRYNILSTYKEPADELKVRDMLESVAQKNYPQIEGAYEKTMWSIVYCPEALYANFYFAENYEDNYMLVLQDKGGFLKH